MLDINYAKSLDSPNGIRIGLLPSNYQKVASNIIIKSEIDDIIDLQNITYLALSKLQSSKIVFIIDENNIIFRLYNIKDNIFLYQFALSQERSGIVNDFMPSTSLSDYIKTTSQKPVNLHQNIKDHYVSIIQNNGNSLKYIAKFNDYKFEDQNSTTYISKKNHFIPSSTKDLGISIMRSFPVAIQDFLLSQPISQTIPRQNLPGLPPQTNTVLVSTRINKHLQALSSEIEKHIIKNITNNEVQFNNLTPREQKLITDYIFFLGLSQSAHQIKTISQKPSSYFTDTENCTIKRNEPKKFTVSHPKEGYFIVRSGTFQPQ